jgi:hypothetical protein
VAEFPKANVRHNLIIQGSGCFLMLNPEATFRKSVGLTTHPACWKG